MAERTRFLVIAALIAALTAVSSWVSSAGQIPFTLQTFFVVLAACLLPPVWASASMLLYVLLGLAGLPVFAAGAAGPGIVVGPTGGYLVGFIVAPALAGLLLRAQTKSERRDLRTGLDVLAII
ncbi:MAG: biotin transporter BioY, partial [Actinomycetes bacterium]|nr:biotin transporter BioY [Actinomycetes bacterium]